MEKPSLEIGNSNWAIKEGELLGYNRVGNDYLPVPITMTRASLGTRVNPEGLVEDVELLGSEEITDGNFPLPNTAWVLSPTFTIADNKLHCVSDGSYQYANQSAMVVGKTYRITFDITGWVSGNIRVRPSGQSPFQTAGSNGSYIFYYTAISNSVLTIERNGTPTDLYIENISVKEATIENLARVDYDGTASSLLAEPQRTNLITYSSDFSNAIWTKSGSSVTLNATTSPDGTINADKLVEDTSTGGHQIQSITSSSNSTIYTTSVFVKYAGREWIRFTDAQSSNRIHFNTLTGVFGTVSGTVIDYNKTALENGWYKLSLTTTSVATAYTPRIALAEADNDVSYTGDGVSGVYIYGCSLEEGSYATSYIPTSGSTVTRNQDIFTRDGIGSLINSTEGTIFVEMAALANDSTNRYISINDGSSTNRIIFKFGTSSNNISALGLGTATSFSLSYSSATITNMNKIALKYKVNDCALWVNGVEVATDTTFTAYTANTLNQINFSNYASSGQFLDAKVKQLQVYKTALTDTQLAALTS